MGCIKKYHGKTRLIIACRLLLKPFVHSKSKVWHVRGGPLDFEHLAKTINPCIADVYREDTVAIFGIAEGIQKIEHVC